MLGKLIVLCGTGQHQQDSNAFFAAIVANTSFIMFPRILTPDWLFSFFPSSFVFAANKALDLANIACSKYKVPCCTLRDYGWKIERWRQSMSLGNNNLRFIWILLWWRMCPLFLAGPPFLYIQYIYFLFPCINKMFTSAWICLAFDDCASMNCRKSSSLSRPSRNLQETSIILHI